jgi:membrane protease YdiL (CAAX protease family)
VKVLLRSTAPFVPYAAVLCGVYWLGSAWVAILLYHAGAIAVLSLSRERRQPPARRSSPLLYATILIFAAGGAILYAIWPMVASEAEVSARLAEFGLSRASWIWFAVYFCAVNPIVEELLWRGFLGPDCTCLHRNDVLFGGYHGLVAAAFVGPIWILPVVVACAFAGWLWRMLRLQSGGLMVPWLTHVAADVSIAAAVYFRLHA